MIDESSAVIIKFMIASSLAAIGGMVTQIAELIPSEAPSYVRHLTESGAWGLFVAALLYMLRLLYADVKRERSLRDEMVTHIQEGLIKKMDEMFKEHAHLRREESSNLIDQMKSIFTQSQKP